MKVAFVNLPTDSIKLPVESGSIAIWTYEVSRRLAKYCDVIVYAARRDPSQAIVELHQGVQYRRISINRDRVLRGLLKVFSKENHVQRPSFASFWYHLGYGIAVANDLRKEQCDVVHIQGFSQFIPVIRFFNPNIKIVLHLHGDRLSQLDKNMMEPRLKKADLVLGCSDFVTKQMSNAFPSIASRFKTIYNAADVHHFTEKIYLNQTNGTHKLLFVGRVSPEKGVHLLVKAFSKIIENYPNTELKIIGPQVSAPMEVITFDNESQAKELAPLYSGSYISQLREMLPSSLADKVMFTGNVMHSKLINYLQEADLLIQPSIVDVFPLTVLEAMASGLPIVATRVGGLTESIKDGETGLLVEANNVDSLAEGIMRIMSDDEQRKSMGKAARKRAAELFSWEKITEDLLERYKTIDRRVD